MINGTKEYTLLEVNDIQSLFRKVKQGVKQPGDAFDREVVSLGLGCDLL
jgi:hypothetical protein